MKGSAIFRNAAVFLVSFFALRTCGAVPVLAAIPSPVFADTETCVHVAVPPLAGKDFLRVSMPFTASPSNSLSAAFGVDTNGDGRLSLREQAVELGWDGGFWFVRRSAVSAWERLEKAGAAGTRLLEAVLWLRPGTSGPRLALSVDGAFDAFGEDAAAWLPVSALEGGTVLVTARGHGVEGTADVVTGVDGILLRLK